MSSSRWDTLYIYSYRIDGIFVFQVVIDPKRTTATFDSTVMAVVHNVSTIHEIKVRREVGLDSSQARRFESQILRVHFATALIFRVV